MPGWLVIALGYLIGCLPAAYLAGKILRGRDIRGLGDKNAGAANAFRELGSWAGIIVFILDAAKGAAVVLMARAAGSADWIVLLAGLAAVTGHNWPVFLGFRGGRGVSTTIGILAVLAPTSVLILTPFTLLVIFWRRNTTPGLAFAFIGFIFVGWWQGVSAGYIVYGLGLAVLSGITTMVRTARRKTGSAVNTPAD